MDISQLCRTCLSTQLLIPIFKDNVNSDCYSAAFYLTTGLKIEKNDGLPQKMCEVCTSFIQDIQNFRIQCREAETRLLSIKETFNNDGKNLKDQVLEAKKQKKGVTKNCQKIKCDSKMYGTANKKAGKEKSEQPDLSKNKCKITDTIEAINTDNKKLDKEDLVNLVKNENKQINFNKKNENYDTEKINCDDNNTSNKYESNCNNDRKFSNDEIYKIELELVPENNADLIKKSDLDMNESEYETEFLDVSFDSDTKDWFFKENVIENSNLNHLKNKISKCATKLEVKTDKNLVNCDTKMVDNDTKTIEDTKTAINDVKMVKTETDVTEKNGKKQRIQKTLIFSLNTEEIEKKIFTKKIDVKNEKAHLDYQLYEVVGNRAICKLCQKEMSKRSIVTHISLRHPGCDESRAKCDFCDSFILKNQMQRHTNKKHGVKCTICMYCHKEYTNSEELIDHVPKCTQKKRRRKTNTKDKESKVECEICNKVMLKASLKAHQDVRHRGIKPVCEHCGLRMGNKLRLLEHLRARHGYAKLECAACEFRTASASALANHMRRHRGERPFVCEQCGAKFHAAYLLAQHKHQHRTHKGVKCEQCPAAFKTNNHLLMHKQACHNNNTYQCGVCAREFKCPRYLTRHQRNVHTHTLAST